MDLQQRIDLLIRLGDYILENNDSWKAAKQNAERQNSWFTSEFTELSSTNIATQFLQPEKLKAFSRTYDIPTIKSQPKTVGLVMAGNIPLVGFHDWLCIFLSGHNAFIKTASKDEVLIKHLLAQLSLWAPEVGSQSVFGAILKGSDAYIATGSNNSARYFEYYFNKYPNIIRRNRTSIAILNGNESTDDLERLSDDIHLYFGLGCRNVTKIYVPAGYDFIPLLSAFHTYKSFIDHHKYKNNYDYQLAILIINKMYYMTNGSVLLQENKALFSPISQLHYEFYNDIGQVRKELEVSADIQCIVSKNDIPFGQAQLPALKDYADKADTLRFLLEL